MSVRKLTDAELAAEYYALRESGDDHQRLVTVANEVVRRGMLL